MLTIFLCIYAAYGLITYPDWEAFKDSFGQPKTGLDLWIAIDLAIYSIFAIFVPAIFLQKKYGSLVATLTPAFVSGILFMGIVHIGFGVFGENESLIFSALVGIWILASMIGLLLWPGSED